VIPATPEFARRVGRVAHELGVPLIVDEVQAGYGRTGTWFAFEQYDLEPDVIVASKALSGIGLPVAVIFYRKSLDVWAPGAHTGTFRGNQLAFAAGTAAVRIMRRDNILGNVRARGEQIAALLEPLTASPWVRDVRGRGLMWGIEMADPVSGEPAGDLARRIQLTALQHGLILECGGRQDCVVRLLPPLNVTEEVVATACAILRDAVNEEVAAHPGA
jgi:diaminobutyrate-2-oxoglutarate transaminase